MADAPKVRSLIHGTDALKRGVPGEIRVTLGHPMENGLRPDGLGNVVPRALITRFERRLDGQLVFAADLYPAISANPYLAFWLRADQPGTLSFEWLGDWGFQHRETRAIRPAWRGPGAPAGAARPCWPLPAPLPRPRPAALAWTT